MTDATGNLPPLPAIFPDMAAPVIRNTAEGRELTLMRWGMPSPEFSLKGRRTDPGVTNIRNTASPHWRRWLGVEHRCLVPQPSHGTRTGGAPWLTPDRQTAEVQIRIALMTRFSALDTAEIVRVS